MAKHRDCNAGLEPEGREEFVRENAPALLRRCEQKIQRLRERVRFLEGSRRQLRAEIARLNARMTGKELK